MDPRINHLLLIDECDNRDMPRVEEKFPVLVLLGLFVDGKGTSLTLGVLVSLARAQTIRSGFLAQPVKRDQAPWISGPILRAT